MKLSLEFDGFDRIEILWRFQTKLPFFDRVYFFACGETRDLFQPPPDTRFERCVARNIHSFLFSVIEEENVAESRGKQREENVESLLNHESGKKEWRRKIFRCNFLNEIVEYVMCVPLDDEDDDEEREAEPYSTVVETDFKFSDFVHR